MTKWQNLPEDQRNKRLNFEMLLEEEQMEYSSQRFWQGLETETEATPAMQTLTKRYVKQTVGTYQYWIDELSNAYKTTSGNANWPLLLFYLGADRCAALTIISLIRKLYADKFKSDNLFGCVKLSTVSEFIGVSAKHMIGFQLAKTEFRDDFLRQSNYQKNWTPKRCRAFAAKMGTIPELPISDFRHFGVNCIKIAEAAGVVRIHNVTEYTGSGKPKTTGVVELDPALYKAVSIYLRNGELNSIVYRPMLVPPVPHTLDESGGLLAPYMRKGTVTRTTGFGQHEQYLVSGKDTDYNLGSTSSVKSLDALNLLQGTEWSVAKETLDVMTNLFKNDTQEGLLPAYSFNAFAFDAPYPEEGDNAEKAAWKRDKEEAYDGWFKGEQKRSVMHTRLALANKLAGFNNFFYHAQSQDFRGRVYCDTVLLNPQSSDFDRGLIQFSHGVRQTDEGMYWLNVHIANLFGIDKVSFDERVDWVNVHLKDLRAVAKDPYETRSFWVDNDTPKKNTTWQRLNAILDLERCLNTGITSVPVQLDGSNNGAQHWAAIMRDPFVAQLTNLMAVEKPQDLYQVVADIATRRIAGSTQPIQYAIAKHWPEGIPRKVAKRTTMCYAYGITPYGCRKYMKEEGHINSDWVPRDKFSAYQAELGNLIYHSIGELMDLPNQGKAFVQECARRVMDNAEVERKIDGVMHPIVNPFLCWQTPTGFRATNTYWQTQPSVVYSSLYTRREVHYQDYLEDEGSRSQNVSALPPNFIHSLDASHLVMTVNRLFEEHGIQQFSMVHDSFGVPAPYIPQLREATKQTFHEIHRQDQLGLFKDYVEELFEVDLPSLPERGDYDINQVLEAEYMFG